MKKNEGRKLQLNRQTLRLLTRDQVAQANGGLSAQFCRRTEACGGKGGSIGNVSTADNCVATTGGTLGP